MDFAPTEQNLVELIDALGDWNPGALQLLIVTAMNQLADAVGEGRADVRLLSHLRSHVEMLESGVVGYNQS